MNDYLHIEHVGGRHQEQRPQHVGERQQGVHLQPVQERQPEQRLKGIEERRRIPSTRRRTSARTKCILRL